MDGKGQPKLQFHLRPSAVQVWIEGGDYPIQTIKFNPGALTQLNKDDFLQTPDINFDGYPDLTLIAGQGLQNTYYDGWLWDVPTQRFTYLPALHDLASPTFDEHSKRIYTFQHGSATDHDRGVYAFVDGKLTQIQRVEQRYDQDTGLFILRTYTLDDQGALRLSDAKTLTQAQLEAQAD